MEKDIPIKKRGRIYHYCHLFGKTRLGALLEVFLPKNHSVRCLVMAGQHGTEPEGTVLLSSVLRTIHEKNLHCAVIPALNPDGLSRGTRCNALGVDLNRNFPTKDWSAKPTRYRWNEEGNKNTELSPGEKPLSEPENKALLSLISSLKVNQVISIHAPLGCIDDPMHSKLGQWMAKKTGLSLVHSVGYPTPGSFGTWAKEKGLHLITFELPLDSIYNHRKNYSLMLKKVLTNEVTKGVMGICESIE